MKIHAVRHAAFALVLGLSASLAAAQDRTDPGDLRTSAWFARASAEARAAEYRFSSLDVEPGVWSAPSRGQELRSRVDAEGIEVFPRSTDAAGIGAPWKLVLGTRACGREGDLRDVGPGEVSVDGVRAELARGGLVEWFVNGEEGIEQGWTLASRPGGVDPLVIVLAIEGGLSLRIDAGGRSGRFVDAAGEARLSYSKLAAWDAVGRELEARLVPHARGAAVRVDDAGAVYPITVDPLLASPTWTAEGNQVQAWFGYAVASAGDVNGDGYSDVIVGASLYDNGELHEGRTFVYHGSAAGLATSPAWTAEPDQASAFFGSAVATAGDVNGDGFSDVIVGAQRYDGGQTDEGRAYVYHGSAAGLAASPAWTAEGNQVFAQFANAVSTAGDVNGDGYSDVIVGDWFWDDGQVDEGRALVYHGSAAGLAASPAWTVESNLADAQFGYSVGAAGDVNGDGYADVIVGALLWDDGEDNEGAAFVYHGSAAGLTPFATWTVDADQVDALLGSSVGTAGDVNGDGYADVVVGAYSWTNGQFREGGAFVYHGSAGGLGFTPAWTGESNQSTTRYGFSVGTAGDVDGDGCSELLVGAYWYDGGQTDEGRVFLYRGSASGLESSASWTAEPDQAEAWLGHAVATAGDVNGDGYSDVIAGAFGHDGGQDAEGRAFVYHGSPSGLATGAAWTTASDQDGARLGYSVSSAGDVNGDGYSDLVVGADRYDGGETDEGAAFVYHGGPGGPSSSPDWMVEGDQANARLGTAVSGAGDVNGDGYDDVVLGAFGANRAQVHHGSASGLAAAAAWTVVESGSFGIAVSEAGDVNGDGYGDVLVGAHSFFGGEAEEGRAFAYHGSAAGLAASPAWTAESNQAFARFGISVVTAGDVNGDGYADAIVGAYTHDGGESDEGAAFVYHGSGAGLGTSPAWSAEPDVASALFGGSVASAGDVNGDGFSDVIVGASWFDGGEVLEGRAYAYHGSAGGLAASPAWTVESDQVGAILGYSVASAGDVNGDGYSDVIVGAPQYSGGESIEGRALLYEGSASGLSTGPAWIAESNQVNALLGFSVAAAGDVNGDGYADVVVGARDFDAAETDEGRVSVYLGNAGAGGWVLAPAQRQPADGAPLALGGRSASPYSVRLQAQLAHELAGFAWASAGPPGARLEWDVVPVGTPFGSTSLGTELATTGAPVLFDELVGGLTPGTVYRWRARFRTGSGVFPVTPWFSVPGNGRTEAKLRTAYPVGASRSRALRIP